jgi:hypothetical protein
MAPPQVYHEEGGQALPAHETKAYNVTGYWDCVWLCLGTGPLACCLWSYEKTLVILPEELTLENKSVCCASKRRVPYGELGSVELASCCGCAAFGGGALGDGIVPGWGCSHDLVAEIVGTLKARQRTRGDQAQIQRAEQTATRLQEVELRLVNVDAKLDALLSHLKVTYPAYTAPAAAVMN